MIKPLLLAFSLLPAFNSGDLVSYKNPDNLSISIQQKVAFRHCDLSLGKIFDFSVDKNGSFTYSVSFPCKTSTQGLFPESGITLVNVDEHNLIKKDQ